MFPHVVVHPSLIPVVGGDPLKETSTAVVTALQGGDQLSPLLLCCARLHLFRLWIERTKVASPHPPERGIPEHYYGIVNPCTLRPRINHP
jgi:hypothetical protein